MMGKTSKSRHDTAVQGTNDNSIVSKSSCAAHHYVEDRFVRHFAAKHPNRSPLINRSYYIRYVAVDCVLSSFLQAFKGTKKQILNLGAGFDALYFNLKAKGCLEDTVYIEVDYPHVMERKAKLICHTPELRDVLELQHGPYQEGIVLQGKDYLCVGADLTKLGVVEKVLSSVGLDHQTPTLLMSEVVLAYLTPQHSSSVLKWASDTFQNAVFWSYEQILPDDGFGKVMRNHFTKLGSPLQTISAYPTMAEQINRHCQRNWEACLVTDLNYLFHNALSPEERLRIFSLELFDEWAEWHLACTHYMVMTAAKGTGNHVLKHLAHKLNMGLKEDPLEMLAQEMNKLNSSETGGKMKDVDLKNNAMESLLKDRDTDTIRKSELDGGVGNVSSNSGVQIFASKSVTSGHCFISQDLSTKQGHAVVARKSDMQTQHSTSAANSYQTPQEAKMSNSASLHLIQNVSELEPNNSENTAKVSSIEPKADPKSCADTKSVVNSSRGTDKNVTGKVAACWFRRFGHCACQINNEVFLIGGFGEQITGGHSRVRNLVIYNTDSETVRTFEDPPALERVFGTCTPLKKDDVLSRICVFGGRLSPKKPCENMVVLGNQEEGEEMWYEEEVIKVEEEVQRWRHTANAVMHQGHEHLLVYGGCNLKSPALDDCWIVNLDTRKWKQVANPDTCNGAAPVPRHSHTATLLPASSDCKAQLIVACGLGEDESVLSDVWSLSLEDFSWKEIHVKGSMQPRYSHSAGIVGSQLFLLGGVSKTDKQTGLTLIDTNTWALTEVAVQFPEHPPVLLYGHQVAQVERDGQYKLLVIGGGGNCFSFGTHFNELYAMDWPGCLTEK